MKKEIVSNAVFSLALSALCIAPLASDHISTISEGACIEEIQSPSEIVNLYRDRAQTWNLGRVKAPRIDARKRVHIVNIEPFASVDSRELSRGPNSKFESDRGIQDFDTPKVTQPEKAQHNTRVSILETQMNEVSTRTVHGNYSAKTATASPPILGENWFFTGNMLWWHVDEGGTDYAQLFYCQSGVSKTDEVQNRRLTFKWDLGFRAGIGKTFDHDKWDLSLNFTWFRAKNSATSSLHKGHFLTPLLPPDAKIDWDIYFYTLDLNLGRHYFVSPNLAFHPYLGLKSAWISQHVKTSNNLFFPWIGPLKTKQKNGFFGLGPQLGIEGKWFLDYGFHLFTSGGGSLLWGDFDLIYKEKNTPLNPHLCKLDFDIYEVVPMAQFQIGIGYETNIYRDTYRIQISALYENQYWWNQNPLPRFPGFAPQRFNRYSEDLSLQGLTVDVQFDF
jgi:hypothetical protein